MTRAEAKDRVIDQVRELHRHAEHAESFTHAVVVSKRRWQSVGKALNDLDALPDTGEADGWQPDINLSITYHVVAYDESWGGYGDNASRDFKDEAAAVAYAQNLRSKLYPGGPRYEPIRVFKKMTMTPITVEIPFALPTPPNPGEG